MGSYNPAPLSYFDENGATNGDVIIIRYAFIGEQNKNPQHLDCGRDIDLTHQGVIDSYNPAH